MLSGSKFMLFQFHFNDVTYGTVFMWQNEDASPSNTQQASVVTAGIVESPEQQMDMVTKIVERIDQVTIF